MAQTVIADDALVTREDEYSVGLDDQGRVRISPTDVSQFIRLDQCERYLRLRYEEVCADPAGMAAGLAGFLDSPTPPEVLEKVAVAEIRPSSSIGRWRERDALEIAELEQAGGDALRAFGYLRA